VCYEALEQELIGLPCAERVWRGRLPASPLVSKYPWDRDRATRVITSWQSICTGLHHDGLVQFHINFTRPRSMDTFCTTFCTHTHTRYYWSRVVLARSAL
jgi:hypothetical protein